MNFLNKFTLLLTILFLTSACSTIKTNPISIEEASALKDKTLVYSKYKELPDFPAQTAVNVQFGLLGVATAISNGNKMINKNNIKDPAIKISKRLAEDLKEHHNVKLVDETNIRAQSNDVSELVELYNGYDYILDVKTLGWSSIYYTSDWNSYRVFYNAHARLIDTQAKAVIAEVQCVASPEYENTNDAPTYAELENGSGMRKELDRSVEHCVDHINAEAQIKVIPTNENVNVVMVKQ